MQPWQRRVPIITRAPRLHMKPSASAPGLGGTSVSAALAAPVLAPAASTKHLHAEVQAWVAYRVLDVHGALLPAAAACLTAVFTGVGGTASVAQAPVGASLGWLSLRCVARLRASLLDFTNGATAPPAAPPQRVWRGV